MGIIGGDTDIHGRAPVTVPKRKGSPIMPDIAPAARAPIVPAYGGGSGGGGGVGSNSLGQISTKSPSQAVFLGSDPTYQNQMAGYQNTLQKFLAEQNKEKTQESSQFDIGQSQLADQRKLDEGSLTDDFASRGLANSGLFGQSYSQLESGYDSRAKDEATQQSSFLQGLTDALSQFKTAQQSGQTQAKQDAIARMAAKFGG